MSDVIEPWRACEAPDRPPAWGCVFCECTRCADVLEELAAERPHQLLGVKFGRARRLLVPSSVLVTCGVSGDAIVQRFGERNDWVREVWLADEQSGHPEGMSPGEAGILQLMREHDIPLPEWNVEVDAVTGELRAAGVRRFSG